jgi:predicted nucleotidyltransferase
VAVDPLDRCVWPPLREPYAAALREAVGHIFARWEPVAIVASGTIIRGTPGPTSDLDLWVLHARPERQRVQRFFNGVPAEIFVNPLERVAGYFESDRRAGRAVTAHLLASGSVVYQADRIGDDVQAQARAALRRPPEPTPAGLTRLRYRAVNWLDDATDVAADDPETCSALAAHAVEEAVCYRFWTARRWQPRPKDTLRALAAVDADLAQHVRAFYRAPDAAVRLRLAHRIVADAVGATGFFEWESDVEAVSP